MKVKTSTRLSEVPPSAIRKLVPYAVAAKKRGVKVYHLNIGDPDIKTPEVMLNVLRNWNLNPIGYDQSQGDPELLTALVGYYQKIGFKFIKEENIQVTVGGSEAIDMAFFATCETGDEIIVFEPFFTTYNSFAVLNHVKLKPILTTAENGFHFPDKKVIEKSITKKTKAIFFNNPNNPTGAVYTKKEIDMLVDLAVKYNLFLICDEVYREFTYDDTRHISILEYAQKYPDKVIVLDSLSKRYSLCGARLGMLVSQNKEVMDGALRIAQARLSAGLVDQKMAAKLTDVSQNYLKEVNREYKRRRDVIYEGLSKIDGVLLKKPEGAFYAVVVLPIKDSEDFCQWLLTDFRDKNETVMLAPAAGFYNTPGLGKNEVRIAYVINIKDLKRSIEIIKKALRVYPGRTS